MTNTNSVAMNLPGTSRKCTGVESEPAVIVDDHSQFDDGKGGRVPRRLYSSVVKRETAI